MAIRVEIPLNTLVVDVALSYKALTVDSQPKPVLSRNTSPMNICFGPSHTTPAALATRNFRKSALPPVSEERHLADCLVFCTSLVSQVRGLKTCKSRTRIHSTTPSWKALRRSSHALWRYNRVSRSLLPTQLP